MIETVCAALLLVALLILAGCRSGATAAEPEPRVPVPAATGAAGEPSSLAELQRRLNQLARSTPPKDLKMGAMCYDTMGPPNRVDFICPQCGSRTAYANPPWIKDDHAQDEPRRRFQLVTSHIPRCRDLIRRIDGIEARLDETELCATCSPTAARPTLILAVRPQAGADMRRTRDLTPDDLRALAAFLDGKDRWVGDQGREQAVRDHLQRIAELLGLAVPPP